MYKLLNKVLLIEIEVDLKVGYVVEFCNEIYVLLDCVVINEGVIVVSVIILNLWMDCFLWCDGVV